MPIRPDVLDTLKRWAKGTHPYPPGGFLQDILKGHPAAAAAHADSDNRDAFWHIYQWIYWNMPTGAYGSEAKYNKWLRSMKKDKALRTVTKEINL
jgi:hypothetical protein